MKYRTDLTPLECKAYYEKRLVYANIAIAVIALVAFLSLLCGTLLGVKMDISAESFAVYTADETKGNSDMAFILKGVDSEVELSLSGIDVLKLATTKDPDKLSKALNKAMEKSAPQLNTLLKQMLPNILCDFVIAEATAPMQEIDKMRFDTSGFNAITDRLFTDKPQLDAIRESFLQESKYFTRSQMGVILTAEQLNNITESYDNFSKPFIKDGTFSILNIFTSQPAVADGARNPYSMMMPGLAMILGIGMLVWGILLILSVTHIFVKNKKVAMWYVKLLGILPCFIFYIVPSLVIFILPKVLSDVIPALPIAIGGTTLISGICVLVLWIVSIFWCHPLKKRIKRANRDMALGLNLVKPSINEFSN